MSNLPSGLRALLLEALGVQPDMELAIVFGSIACGHERPDSDVDLAIDVGHELSATDKQQLISEIAVRTGRPVDLVDLRTCGEPLLGQILAHGAVVAGTKAAYAATLRKHLFDSADFLPYRRRILAERRRAWIGL